MLIWRGIAPVRVEDGVQVEGPDVEREAIQALQAVAVVANRLYWLLDEEDVRGTLLDELRAAMDASGFDAPRGRWRT